MRSILQSLSNRNEVRPEVAPHGILTLFIIIFIEGYVVLSNELLVIRQLTPFVGSTADIIAVVISAVLLPLSLGYYWGGRHKLDSAAITALLRRNFLLAAVFTFLGYSYFIIEGYFFLFELLGLESQLLQVSIFCAVFVVYPTFILGQTVPLITHFLPKEKLSVITGKILFFSTIGSFIGSIFTTLVIMSLLGVNYVVMLNVALLALIFWLVYPRITNATVIFGFLFSLTLIVNAPSTFRAFGYVGNGLYNHIQMVQIEDITAMKINRGFSSLHSENPQRRAPYLRFLEKYFFQEDEKKNVLVIGAGGFTFGIDDYYNDYLFIDIDPSLKGLSEQHLVKQTLTSNKKFIKSSARAFVRNTKEKYDLVLMDVFANEITTPAQLLTTNFFEDLKKIIKENGIITFNIVMNPNFGTDFDRRVEQSLRHSFPYFSRQIIGDFNPFSQDKNTLNSVIYIIQNKEKIDGIYSDNLTTADYDR